MASHRNDIGGCGLLWNCNRLSSVKSFQLSRIASPHSYPPHSHPPSPHLPTQPLFIALTESKLTSVDDIPPLPGYIHYHTPAVTDPLVPHRSESGGLILYIRSSVSSEHRPLLQHSSPYSLLVESHLPSIGRCILGVFYHREKDPNSLNSILKCMDSARTIGVPLVLVGDFNARHITWCSTTNSFGTRLFDYCSTSHLFVVNSLLAPHLPTRVSGSSSSTIDLLISSHPHLFASVHPDPSLEVSSDHIPLTFSINKKLHPNRHDRPPPYYRWRIEHGDWTKFTSIQNSLVNDFLPRLRHFTSLPSSPSSSSSSSSYQHHHCHHPGDIVHQLRPLHRADVELETVSS